MGEMVADWLGPYRSDVVVNAFNSVAAERPSTAEVMNRFRGASALEARVIDQDARLSAALGVALEQLGCLGREVAELRARVDRLEGRGHD